MTADDDGMTRVTVQTRKPEKYLLIDRETGNQWEIRNGHWERALNPIEPTCIVTVAGMGRFVLTRQLQDQQWLGSKLPDDDRELEEVLAEVITPGEIFDTRLYGRAVLADLRSRGYDIVKVNPT